MPSINDVQIKVVVNSDTKGATEAQSALGGFGGSLKNIAEIAAGIGLERVTEEIVSLGKEAAKFALDTASQFEQSKTQFDVLLGSAQKGSKILNEIAQYEPNTSFDFGQLTDATQQLLSFGVAQDRVIPDLKVLGDISLGNSAKLKELAFAFGEVNSQQKLTAHEARIFTLGAHIPIYQLLADYVNKTGKEFAGATSAINTNVTALTAHSSKVKDNSIQIETLKNSATIAQEKLDFLSHSHTKAETAAFNHKIALEKLHNTVDITGDKLDKLTNKVNTSVAATGSHAQVTAGQIRDMITAGDFSAKDVEAALTLSTEKGGMFFEAMKHHMNTFSGVMSSIRTQFQQTALEIMGFDMKQFNKDGTENLHFGEIAKGSLFDELKNSMQDFLKFIKEHKEEIANFFKDFAGGLGDNFKKIVDTIKSLQGFLKNLWNSLKEIADITATLFIPIWNHLEDVYKRHQHAIDLLAKVLTGTLFIAIIGIIEILAVVIEAGIKWADAFLAVGEQIKRIAVNVANTVISMIDAIINAINAFVQGAIKIANGIPGVHISVGQIGNIPTMSGGSNIPALSSLSPTKLPSSSSGSVNPVYITNNNNFNNFQDIQNSINHMSLQVANASGR